MVLTPEQWDEMYTLSVANGTHIEWIRKKLIDNDAIMIKRDERLRIVETEQAFMRGKMARFAGGVAAICAISVNAVVWLFGHLGAK